jgi:hypothetical protein
VLSGDGKVKCLFIRLRISHALDGRKPLPSWTRKHLLHCPPCRRFHSASVSLQAAQREESAGRDASRWSSLAERVWTGAAGEKLLAPAGGLPCWHTARAAALAAGLALLLLFGPLYMIRSREGGSSRTETTVAEDIGFEQAVKLLNFHLARIYKISLGACVDEPLKAEIERLSRDAESVQRLFLALLPPHSMLRDR